MDMRLKTTTLHLSRLVHVLISQKHFLYFVQWKSRREQSPTWTSAIRTQDLEAYFTNKDKT